MARSYTRRRLLRITSAGAVGCLAGCNGLDGGDDSGDTTPTTTAGERSAERPSELNVVPEGATMVAHVDVTALLDSPVGESAIEGALSSVAAQRPTYDGPESYEEALDAVETGWELDPRGVSSVTAFVGDRTGGEIAFVAETNYDESEVVEMLETRGTVSEETYEDVAVHVDPTDSALGVLGDGRYVVGRTDTVESVVDVTNGNEDAVSGVVVTAYGHAPSGPIRFGTVVPDAWGQQSTNALTVVETIRGGMSTEEGQHRLVVEMETTDADAAGRLTTGLEDGLAEFQPRMERESGPLDDAFSRLDDIAVRRDGSTVSMMHTAGAEVTGDLIAVVVAVVGTFVLGLGETQEATHPRASFEFDYDADAGTVTITHQGGDTIDGSNLYVRGTTGNGAIDAQWAADYGVNQVWSGESVTVADVSDAFELRVVWDPSDQDISAVLAVMVGPGT
ncbi:type IV pilin [Halapricum desulfuricans]|uniref:Pilin/Flagellin, FlaG/FlaF family n=1 Tax=Halapricum desulfuricans TaxID=2841257 RepID=A0A897NQG4_9EURY|nr:type IV pilin N-terminal domain-containing protein [Halapricum desulfuricans]QSG14481.1 Pilin/Flagellin, FlaG/FlaF family [Halapricum desulfuricans]